MAREHAIDRCAVCGAVGKLSWDHIPPEKAFNDHPLLFARMDLDRTEAGGQVVWAGGRTSQKGNVFGNICEHCDNCFGSWYNRAYIDLAKYLAECSPRGGDMILVPSVAYPLRVLKTAVQCFASSLGREFVDCHDWMRGFLLNRESRAMPLVPRVLAFAVGREGAGRGTGPVLVSDARIQRPAVLAKFAFWPLGFVLCYEELDLGKRLPLVDISHWASFGYNERIGVTVAFPVNDLSTPFPLDYRSPQEVITESGQVPPWFK